MIFVTVGTEKYPFDRLIKMVEDAVCELGIDINVICQTGHSRYVPKIGRWEKFFTFQQVKELMKNSRVVISHAGVGSTLLCLSLEKKPIIVPRLFRYGEAIDDHQIKYAERMFKEGYVMNAQNKSELKKWMYWGLQNPVYMIYRGDNENKRNLINYMETVIGSRMRGGSKS